MSHFAQVVNDVVQQVIVAEQDFINTLEDKQNWIQTSYNTYGGVHTNGGTPLRANYAGVGYIYDKTNDVFYAPKPYPSWTISAPSWLWQAPVAAPTDGKNYKWDEATTSWKEVA